MRVDRQSATSSSLPMISASEFFSSSFVGVSKERAISFVSREQGLEDSKFMKLKEKKF